MIVLRFEPVYRLTGDADFALAFAARFPAGLAIADARDLADVRASARSGELTGSWWPALIDLLIAPGETRDTAFARLARACRQADEALARSHDLLYAEMAARLVARRAGPEEWARDPFDAAGSVAR